MEEKKRTNKWSYSTSGKIFRGFLCMITFAAFVVSAVITAYAVERYGKNIIFDPEPDFSKHYLYYSELESEVWNLIYNIHRIYHLGTVMDDGVITVADYSVKRSRNYDLQAMYYEASGDPWWGAELSGLGRYYMNSDNLAYPNLADYNVIQDILSDLSETNDYLYLNTENFRELFQQNGLQNTNERFSDRFPEDAYFIFDLGEINNLGSYLTAEECEVRGVKYEDKRFLRPLIDDVDFMANYAVYQPEEDLFYTPYDDYFGPMDCYIYNLNELKNLVEAADPYYTRYDSIILPMLECYNYSVTEFVNKACQDYGQVEEVKASLRDLRQGGILYYYEQGKNVSSNMEKLSAVEAMPNHYQIKKDTDNRFFILQDGEFIEEINFANDENIWQNYPVDATLSISIVPGTLSSNLRAIVRYYQEYEYLVQYIRVFGIVAILTLIFTVIQAVQLIQTTGKSNKEDTERTLNRFDKLPTELWLIVVIGLTIVCIICGKNTYEMLYPILPYLIGVYPVFMTVIKALCIAMPFALAVMLFTLSFVRRIKNHNLWNRMLLRRIFAKDIKRVSMEEMIVTAEEKTSFGGKVWKAFLKTINAIRNFFRNMKGTRKLAALFVLYIVVNFICTVVFIGFIGMDSAELSLIGGVLYLMFQLLAVFETADIIRDINKLTKGVEEITKGDINHKIENDKASGIFKELTDGINHIGDGLKMAVETSLKDERMKTELITNVSHDLKTPLTSIINYIELLKAEKMPTPEAEHYIEVLDNKAQRMKQLAEDLVEAAKATSGNIELEMMPIAFDELMKQAFGEFEDKFAKKELSLITHYTDEKTVVLADGRRLYRVIENVLQNVYKYALSGTRVYADLDCREKTITFMLKNISAAPLNISPEELMERFTRGDSSRTTEGSGLGLSIAKDLTNLQGGSFEIQLDGDLFKVIIQFPQYEKEVTL